MLHFETSSTYVPRTDRSSSRVSSQCIGLKKKKERKSKWYWINICLEWNDSEEKRVDAELCEKDKEKEGGEGKKK